MTYRKRYGSWAGNPSGRAPDLTRCCESVVPNERGAIPHQCRRKRGYGPDGEYCKQHDPSEVARRRAEADRKYREETNKLRYGWYGKKFHDTLKQIADGHNDARGLAQEVLSEFERGSY